MKKTVMLNIRLPETLRATALKCAKQRELSLSAFVRRFLKREAAIFEYGVGRLHDEEGRPLTR